MRVQLRGKAFDEAIELEVVTFPEQFKLSLKRCQTKFTKLCLLNTIISTPSFDTCHQVVRVQIVNIDLAHVGPL